MAIAKVTEISASSSKGFEDAIQAGITRAARTLEHIRGAWLKDLKVVVENGRVTEYRVRMKVTFVLKD
jgi:flavin-binding protein dodecin